MADSTQLGAFLPTTLIWDVQQISEMDVNSREFKELLVRMYQYISDIAKVVNVKDTGYYDINQYVNGQQFLPKASATPGAQTQYRPAFRKLVVLGALPNNDTIAIPHGITVDANTTFTRIYGVANNPTGLLYVPLPYVSTTEPIEMYVDNTHVNVITTVDYTAYTICYAILEYLLY